MSEWQPISTPPIVEGMHSHRFLGILKDGLHVFAQYTPFYLGRGENEDMLWIAEGFRWEKPTHWMPLPEPPK